MSTTVSVDGPRPASKGNPVSTDQAATSAPSPGTIQARFELGVSIVIFSWPALSLAVQNQWGGPDSEGKREWLAGVISDMFTERPSTVAEDIEDTLAQVMDEEFEVVVDDGSIEETAEKIMRLHEATARGDFDVVDTLHAAWLEKKGSLAVKVQKGGNASDEEEDEDEEDEGDDDDDDVEMQDSPTAATAPQPKQKQEPEVDAEGFTKVVTKKKR